MELDPWHDFFVASAGASAALAGLIIVAMSVNIVTIIGIPSMTSRAAATIANLVLVVVVSIVALVPDLGNVALGTAITVCGAGALYIAVDSARNVLSVRAGRPIGQALVKGAVLIVPVALVALGGIFVCFASPAGLDLVALGTVLAFVGSVTNAWVLLVEILR